MTDIPEHIVERVARAIVSCWLDSEAEIDAEWTEYEEEARAAIEALVGRQYADSLTDTATAQSILTV